jgi:ribosomal-protein-alanine N-acetyltransferase
MNYPLQLATSRLKLIPCSLEVAQAASTDKSQVEKLLGASVPDDWYKSEVQDFFPKYVQMLIDDPSQLGWGAWLVIRIADSTLIGHLGFAAKPDAEGSVEMGYEVLPAYRNQGYAFEAVQALVNWAFTQPELKRIIAYCPQDHFASIRILEKLGMQQLGTVNVSDFPFGPVFKWELKIEPGPEHH